MPDISIDTKSSSGDEAASLADRIAYAREMMRMTQDELAHRLGVTTPIVTDWEDGRLAPRANKVQMVAGVLGVSLRWLLTGEGDGIEPAAPDDEGAEAIDEILDELGELRSEVSQFRCKLDEIEDRLRLVSRTRTPQQTAA